jgi:hypothetical protein
MKQEWVIHRQTVQQIDGQRRWDLAYQCLLKWAEAMQQEQGTLLQEANHESGNVCPSFDQPPDVEPDH